MQSHPVESVVQYCLDSFAAIPLLPEGGAQTVSQFRTLVHQVLDRQAHPADDIAMALAGDRPVQAVGIMVFPCPACHHLFGDERIAVGTPFEIGGYTGITAPVAEGTFPVPFGKPPQDQPGGFDGLCSNGCQHAFLALLWVKKLTRLFYHKTRYFTNRPHRPRNSPTAAALRQIPARSASRAAGRQCRVLRTFVAPKYRAMV